MSLKKYTIIDGSTNEKYEIFLSPSDYEKALSDKNVATDILENIKASKMNPKEREEINNDIYDEGNENKENNTMEKTKFDDNENVEAAIWSRNATLLFLTLYQEYAQDLNNGKCNQKSIFQKISQKLGDNKYFVTSKQCMTKLASMKRMYKKIKDHNSKSGNDRQTWQYYEEMEEIFGNKPWVKPLSTQSSTANYSTPSAEKVSNDEPPPKTMKLSNIVDKHFQKLVEIKEQSREDRKIHHESAIQRLDTLNSLLQKVIEREVKK